MGWNQVSEHKNGLKFIWGWMAKFVSVLILGAVHNFVSKVWFLVWFEVMLVFLAFESTFRMIFVVKV